MAIISCPNCTLGNNILRTRCRSCGSHLREPSPRRARGRISFEVDAARSVSLPNFHDIKESIIIPVLFEGKDVGIHVAAVLYTTGDLPPTQVDKNRLADTAMILKAALVPRPRLKGV